MPSNWTWFFFLLIFTSQIMRSRRPIKCFHFYDEFVFCGLQLVCEHMWIVSELQLNGFAREPLSNINGCVSRCWNNRSFWWKIFMDSLTPWHIEKTKYEQSIDFVSRPTANAISSVTIFIFNSKISTREYRVGFWSCSFFSIFLNNQVVLKTKFFAAALFKTKHMCQSHHIMPNESIILKLTRRIGKSKQNAFLPKMARFDCNPLKMGN